ncbi:small-conductance mechanosensitive channel [Tahibacter aquaticus]|uniref:Small-conductance mechanosensitive channel n=1 Tax=Tahibacter aquaticus TaxID=520092 RepID=A0A4R6Z0H0_9GAMM|nr:mechanosensitive ion channel domain-containing protein [Tahibacter aquaticus]TDR44992.1 small-conductance mechanosensitive channel [Tahibacter aquaticus]
MRWLERSGFAALLLALSCSSPLLAQTAARTATAETVLKEVPGLDRVESQRYGKVLILEGKVVREADRELAEKIAQANNDGGQVVNRIEVSTSTLERIIPTLRVSAQKLSRIVGSAPLLLVAIFVIWACWRAGRWLSQRAWVGRRARSNPFVGELIRQAIRLAGAIFGVLFALEVMDAMTLAAALLGSAGVAGIALGFAFRDLLENYIAGVLLSLRRPFAPDDNVSIDGHQGVVVGMNSRATLLMTYDGNQLSLPNALVFKAVMINYTSNGRRRFDFVLSVEPGADLGVVMREGLQAVKDTPDVLAEPAPSVQLMEATREEIRVQFLAWVDQRQGNFGAARSEALRRARAHLKGLGVDFSPPTMRLVASNDGATAARPLAGKPVPAASASPKPRPGAGETTAPAAARPDAAVADAVAEARRELGEQDLLKQDRNRERR